MYRPKDGERSEKATYAQQQKPRHSTVLRTDKTSSNIAIPDITPSFSCLEETVICHVARVKGQPGTCSCSHGYTVFVEAF
jgi:hypothetical protein